MLMQQEHGSEAQPPERLRRLFKRWQKSGIEEIMINSDIIDLTRANYIDHCLRIAHFLGREADVQRGVTNFLASNLLLLDKHTDASSHKSYEAVEIKVLPGFFLLPALLTEDVQIALLDRLMHRDLSNPAHKTNMHLFHHIEYPAETSTERNQDVFGSFFGVDPDQELQPKDATIHKPITIDRMLQRKLRWMTLGGQYDWTAKVYPDEQPPEFPPDIAQILRAYFPEVEPEAAIINFYSPGDTLSVHRDVSEDCDRGLISISLGCDGIFLVGSEDGSRHATIRLRSGDAVLMTGQSRFAWHAVPKVLSDTCPKWLEAWPTAQGQTSCERWRGWMKTKRININVRQMRDRVHGE